MIDISIVVTVYNGEKYIRDTLLSIAEQGVRNIEIIVVDDASTDRSRSIISTMQDSDDRIILIEHEKNQGTHASRRDGVLKATGKYLMFCDQDDTYKNNALETILNEIETRSVDMLQYGVEVVNCGTQNEKEVQGKIKYYTPYTEKTINSELLRECFIEKKFSINIWNKIYKGDICRKAFQQSKDAFLCYHEDMYENFMIQYESETYSAIEDRLYVHFFGRGTTGHQEMALQKYNLIASGAQVGKLVGEFLDSKKNNNYNDVVNVIKGRTIRDCIKYIVDFVPEENQDAALELLIKYADGVSVANLLFKENQKLKKKLVKKNKELKKIENSKSYKIGKTITKPIKNISK